MRVGIAVWSAPATHAKDCPRFWCPCPHVRPLWKGRTALPAQTGHAKSAHPRLVSPPPSNIVAMFDELPETIPHKNKRKLEAFATAFGLQIVLVAILIVVQMAMPEKLGEFQLLETLYMAPPPPPPAAPLSAAPEPA